MMDFDERDLLRHAEAAGFPAVHVGFHVYTAPAEHGNWDGWMRMSGNPTVPTMREMFRAPFTNDEFALFERHVRPGLQRGGTPVRNAIATVVATKASR